MDQKLNFTGCYHHRPISLSVFPENEQDIPGAICNWSKCSFWGRLPTSTGRGRMPPNLLQHQNKTHQSYWLLVFSCGAKRLWSPENSLAHSPAFLWQLQSYVNYTGASHFRNFPPQFTHPCTHKTQSWGGREQPWYPNARATKRCQSFMKWLILCKQSLHCMERSNLKSTTYYRVLLMRTALQSFSGLLGHVHMQLHNRAASLMPSFCPWCGKLALRVAQTAFHFSLLVVPQSKEPYLTFWNDGVQFYIRKKLKLNFNGDSLVSTTNKSLRKRNLMSPRSFVPVTRLTFLQTRTHAKLLLW